MDDSWNGTVVKIYFDGQPTLFAHCDFSLRSLVYYSDYGDIERLNRLHDADYVVLEYTTKHGKILDPPLFEESSGRELFRVLGRDYIPACPPVFCSSSDELLERVLT